MSAGTGPLAGVKVVELGVWVAGPGAAGIMADWGADVVKLEPPAGDPGRHWNRMLGGSDDEPNAVFELDNRGKRGLVVDLTTEQGREVAERLLAQSDVLVTNYRAAALARLGLDHEGVLARHPHLVYAIVTGYGLDGPDADRGAYDVAAYWSRAGIAELLRQPGGPLPFQRAGMGDHSAAMTAAAMINAALLEKVRTGRGQLVSTSLLRQGAYTIGFDLNVALMWGRSLAIGSRETMYSPTANNYVAGDGKPFWLIGLQGERHWPALARAVGRPEWLEDERYAGGVNRAMNSRQLIADLDVIFATKTLEEWAVEFDKEPELFWAPVNTVDDVLVDPQFWASGAVVQVPDEDGASAEIATPADFGGRPPEPRWRAPRLGEHTRELLAELGYDDDATAALLGDGVAVEG